MTIAVFHTGILEIKLEGCKSLLEPTGWHPLYSETAGGWVRADTIQSGDLLRTHDGVVRVESITHKTGIHRTYNLEVETRHCYYVSNASVLAHNDCPGEGPLTKAKADVLKDIAHDPDYGRYSNQNSGPYSHLEQKGKIEPFEPYSSTQRKQYLQENRQQNGSKLVSDQSGKEIPDESRAHIDHNIPRSKGGENSNENARVLLDKENWEKSDK